MASMHGGPPGDVDAQGIDALSTAALSQLTGTLVLHCLGKQPAPPSLAGDLAHVAKLPSPALGELWSVLEPNLGAINTPASTRAVESFCERLGVDPHHVVPVVGACRFLFLRGAERATPASALEEDVTLLLRSAGVGDEALGRALAHVLPCYERAASRLRGKAVEEALTDHGLVVTDVKWRVDRVSHANTGEGMDVAVTLLTLRYREGDRTGQVTLQLLPERLRELQRACELALR
jgi:hypothetical protein